MLWTPESHSRRSGAWPGMRSPHSPEPHKFQNIILQSALSVGWSAMCSILIGGAIVHAILPNILLNSSLFCSPLADRTGWWGGVVVSHCCFKLHALWYLDLGNWERFLLVRKLWLSVYLTRLVSSLHSVPVQIERRTSTPFYWYSPLFCISYGLFFDYECPRNSFILHELVMNNSLQLM